MAFLSLLLNNDGLCTTDGVPAHLLGHTGEGKADLPGAQSPQLLGKGWRGGWMESGRSGTGLLLSSRFTHGRVKGGLHATLVPWLQAPQPVHCLSTADPSAVTTAPALPFPAMTYKPWSESLLPLTWPTSRPVSSYFSTSSPAHLLGSWTWRGEEFFFWVLQNRRCIGPEGHRDPEGHCLEYLKAHLSFCRLLFRAACKTILVIWDSAEVCGIHTLTHTCLIMETTWVMCVWLARSPLWQAILKPVELGGVGVLPDQCSMEQLRKPQHVTTRWGS